MILDHLAVTATTLEEGVAYVEDALGVALQPGGQHPLMGTHNQLLGMGPEYFEVIAIDPTAQGPTHSRWFDMDRFKGHPRLTNWIIRVDDLEAARAAAPKGAGEPIALTRADLAWSMLVPDNGILPFDNCFPALISWASAAHPASMLQDEGVRLSRLEIAHPEADALRAVLPDFVDPRVVFVPGAPEMRATFETPSGPRSLT